MGESTLTGTEFGRLNHAYSSYNIAWVGSYTYTQNVVNNTTTLTLYGSMYTDSASNVRSANSTDIFKVNDVTISPPTPSAYRYSSSMEYGYSVNRYYSLFGSTTLTVNHNANGTFPATTVTLYAKSYHHNNLSGSYTISGLPTIDRTAPTVSISNTAVTDNSLTIKGTSNVNCDIWYYKVGSGSWVQFSTTNGTSASTTITGLSLGTSYTVSVKARKTANHIEGTSSSATYTTTDSRAPTVSASTSSVTANSCVLSASANWTCNKWEYSLNGGSFTTFSTTSGTSASTTITGLSPAVTYSITVRATRASNSVTGTATTSATTLGYSVITAIGNINVDSSATLTFTVYDANFYHWVRFKIGDTVIKDIKFGKAGGTGSQTYSTSSASYTFPASLLPSSTSTTVTAILYTYTASSYSDASYIGSTSKTFRLTVPNTATYQPSVSITCTPYNTNTWINSKSAYVGGYTKVNIAVSSSAGSGSSINSTSVSPASTAISGGYRTNNNLNAGAQTITVTVTDKRGRSKSASSVISFKTYSSPSFSTYKAERGTYSGGTWTANVNGDHIRVQAVGSCSLTDIGNAVSVTVKIGSTNPSATSGNYYYFTGTSAETSYSITGTVTDSVGTTSTSSLTVSSIAVPFNLNTTMPAGAFGKVAEKVKTLEIAQDWSLVANGKNNTMAYLPYSWEAHSTEDTQTAGFMRIATVKITGTYAMNSIVFRVQFRGSAYVSNLYLAFTSTASGTEPTVSSFTWDGYRICNAYVIKSDTETYTWHVYVAKQTANEYATVRVYTSANFMAKGNITYSPAPVVAEVPSGATVATMPVTPSIQLQASQYYNEDKYGINMRNSDIIGANGIWFSDTANARDEGIIYPRSNGNYDNLYALDGEVYLRRNQAKNATMVAGTRLLTVDDIPKDYIIAEWTEAISGMNGTWNCVAWQSGKRECYGTFTFSVPANNWTAWGSLYEATPSTRFYIYYPASFFGAVPTLLCSISGSAGASGYELYGSHTKTNGPQVIVLRPSALGSATTYSINLHAIGHS